MEGPVTDPGQTVNGYYDDWLDIQDGTKSLPGIEVVGFEPRIKNDSGPYNSVLQNVITTAKSRGLSAGVFAEASTSCQGYWTKGAVEKYIDFDDEFRNNFEWTLSKGYNYVITELTESLVSRRAKVTSNNGNKSLSFAPTYLNETNIKNKGFTMGFSLKMSDFSGSGKSWLAEMVDNNNKAWWKLGIDKTTKKIFVRRWVDGSPNYYWDVTFWKPPFTNFADYSGTSRVQFYLIQEQGEMRLHVGMPDGKFDCMYLANGMKDLRFYENSWSSLGASSMSFVFSNQSQDRYVNQTAMCRTDVYKHAIDNYFTTVGNPTTSFSLLDHINPYLGSSDAPNDKVVNDNDNSRISGGCTYFQGSGNFPSSRLALEEESDIEDTEIPQEFSFYPNPNEGIINLNMGELAKEPGQATLQLFDLAGKLEANRVVDLTEGQSEVVWDVRDNNNLPTGIYILKVRTDAGRTYSGRVIMDCGCGD